MSDYARHILVALLALLTTLPAYAQQTPAGQVQAVRDAYQRLDYGAARSLGREALAAFEGFTPEQLADVHVILAQIDFAENDQPAARSHFEAALQLVPGLTLDPLLVSPKTLAFFGEVRQAVADRRTATDGEAPPLRYVIVQDPRPGAALRSAVLPGWGQRFKGEERKGWALMGAWSATAGGTGIAHLIRARRESDYLDAATPDDAAARYEAFDTWHKVRNNLLVAAAGVWLYSYVDALFAGRPDASGSSAASNLSVAPILTPDGPGWQARVRLSGR